MIVSGIGRYKNTSRSSTLIFETSFKTRHTGSIPRPTPRRAVSSSGGSTSYSPIQFIKSMFAPLKTKLDIGKEMDAGKIILINNSKALLGDEGCRVLRALLYRPHRSLPPSSGPARRSDQKKPCLLSTSTSARTSSAKDAKIATILDECRSQKIALILAHQRTAQIHRAPVLDAVSTARSAWPTAMTRPSILADKLRMDAEFLCSSVRAAPSPTFVRDLTPHGSCAQSPVHRPLRASPNDCRRAACNSRLACVNSFHSRRKQSQSRCRRRAPVPG